MSFLNRIMSAGRVRTAARRVAKEPTPTAYAELAQEYAVAGDVEEVLRVTAEGLRLFPGDVELKRLGERTRSLRLESRIRELQQELRSAPRPAVRKELCELLIEAGRVARAEEVANEWHQSTKSGESAYYRALARTERFFADRRRDDGRQAYDLVKAAEDALPGDPRPVRLMLQLCSRLGAWSDARRSIARLLEHFPGDPALEARFRTVVALSDGSKGIDQALREVERSGRLVDDEPEKKEAPESGNVRPMLQSLVKEPGVQAAFFTRGSTALVQGPKGATAERAARGVREVVGGCRAAARKLGLGAAQSARLEGDFGTLVLVIGEQGSAAVWCDGPSNNRHEESLRQLAGAASAAGNTEQSS
ncbi:MAG: hypothetical protein NTY35_15685 [Planctomycetota bacterium]|nr:hypothetical protein [Planctomycetota bacterium]